ncbi:RHS repeat domain-containing protein [Gynuella sunshinyii]|uniref:Rhs family protein n=1 Tax=Gynuella sunshinyii YC6258 TaxID=1445510 RepID=A0A0C5VJG2_9GAMM|nr:RHS repeat-associated core domain-containing protein [Gynuella sunshinyii]AJQ94757.1 rhs family protein [Gynuella sunshinyii YC6258]
MYDYELGLLDIEADHLGTAKALYSHETGEQLWATEHEVYGKTKNSQSHKTHPRNGFAVDPKLRFAGQYEDIETGLYQNFNRYYDPRTGRYISHDPIGLAGGLNVYQYCPNPVEWVDPLRLSCKEVPWSSASVKRAAEALERGETQVSVRNRQEAEEIFIGVFSGKGYHNAEAFNSVTAKEFFRTIDGKEPYYHWDDIPVSNIETKKVYMANHSPDDPHSAQPHLQLHPVDGKVIRIYWPSNF